MPGVRRRACGERALTLAGITTHFANIEDTTNHDFAESQIADVRGSPSALAAIEPSPFLRHAACSAAALLFNRTHLDLARVGIALYGLWPSKETYVSCLGAESPRWTCSPVLSWKTRIAQVKQVPEGGYVGYGCSLARDASDRHRRAPGRLLRGLRPRAVGFGARAGSRQARARPRSHLHEHVHGGRHRHPGRTPRGRGGRCSAARATSASPPSSSPPGANTIIVRDRLPHPPDSSPRRR